MSNEEDTCLIGGGVGGGGTTHNSRGSGGNEAGTVPPKLERHEIVCPNIGTVVVHLQGTRSGKEVVIMTVQDLGCDPEMLMEFTDHPRMIKIRDRTVWLHVSAPGQSRDAPDLPADYQYPMIRQIGEDLVCILDHLKISQVVCFGEGAGANILARFALTHMSRVLGVCFLHATGTAASFQESLKEKMIKWNLEDMSDNPTVENYLVIHRFGSKVLKSQNKEESKALIEGFKETLRNRTNMRNLKKFVEAYLKRTTLSDNIKNLKCPVLLMTGQLSLFYETTRALHQLIMKSCEDKSKIDFIEVSGVANVLEERPDKLAECFQYFLQGLGLVSSIPMHNVPPPVRNRRMSMEDYDKPLRERKMSGCVFITSPERKYSSGYTNEYKETTGNVPGERKISTGSAESGEKSPSAVDPGGKSTWVKGSLQAQPLIE